MAVHLLADAADHAVKAAKHRMLLNASSLSWQLSVQWGGCRPTMCVADEHYVPTALAHAKQEGGTTCMGSLIYTDFGRGRNHTSETTGACCHLATPDGSCI